MNGPGRKYQVSGSFKTLQEAADFAQGGDLIAVMSAGAYGAVQAGTYNTRALIPEVMVNGVTGFVVNNLEEALVAVQKTNSLDRAACRRIFEQRFTDSRMAEEYLDLYNTLPATPAVRRTAAGSNPKS